MYLNIELMDIELSKNNVVGSNLNEGKWTYEEERKYEQDSNEFDRRWNQLSTKSQDREEVHIINTTLTTTKMQ